MDLSTNLVRDILITDEYKDLLKAFLEDPTITEQVSRERLHLQYEQEWEVHHLIASSSVHRMPPNQSLLENGFLKELEGLFHHATFLLHCDPDSPVKVYRELLGLFEGVDLKEQLRRFLTIFQLVYLKLSGEELQLNEDGSLPDLIQWNQEKYDENDVWTTTVADRTVSYTSCPRAMESRAKSTTATVDPDVFILGFEKGITASRFPSPSIETEESRDKFLIYKLRGVHYKDPDLPNTLLLNSAQLQKVTKVKNSAQFVESKGQPVQVDLDRIKKYITLLVYEKVPDTS